LKENRNLSLEYYPTNRTNGSRVPQNLI
jgi:hypothetical protein